MTEVKSKRPIHETVPVLVWADIDVGIADVVRHLNTIDGVRTLASCQGTLGEGGPAPYGPQVMVSWRDEVVLDNIKVHYPVEITHPNANTGYVYP